MYEVFISYRSDDAGWAGRLHDRLVSADISVFYSGSDIAPGEDWTEKIRSALDGCRLFLAVVGQNWVSAKHLASLGDESKEDWVRRELLEASQRPGVTIVPVLVGGQTIPSLPPRLSWFAKREAFGLTDKKWTIELAELLRRITTEWLANSPRRVSGGASMLPFLCDRIIQEDKLSDVFFSNSATLLQRSVVVVPGHYLEAHDGFLERVTRLRTLERLLGAAGRGVDPPVPLQWELDPIGTKDEEARRRAYQAFLRRTLKRAALEEPASDADLDAFLASAEKPRLFLFDVTSEECARHGKSFILDVASAWGEIVRGVGAGAPPAQPRNVLWIDLQYLGEGQSIDLEGAEVCRLPDLRPVTKTDIIKWLDRREVKPAAEAHRRELISLVDRASDCCGPERLHMHCFAVEARKLLQGS